jgi:hypothetical protein
MFSPRKVDTVNTESPWKQLFVFGIDRCSVNSRQIIKDFLHRDFI